MGVFTVEGEFGKAPNEGLIMRIQKGVVIALGLKSGQKFKAEVEVKV